MTTVSQVKKAVQPLLQRNPDLALVGRHVVIRPVHHIVSGIHIDRVSNPELFNPIWTVNVLFAPPASGSDRRWGTRLYHPWPRSSWLGHDTAMSDLMCEQIEQVALPILRQTQTLDDFAAFSSVERFPGQQLDAFPHIKIFVDIARGDFAEALKICELMKSEPSYGSLIPNTYKVITKTFHPMLAASDRAGLARYLRECELDEVKRRKFEKIWEPTPFPFEL
jgi:hypothetical protein